MCSRVPPAIFWGVLRHLSPPVCASLVHRGSVPNPLSRSGLHHRAQWLLCPRLTSAGSSPHLLMRVASSKPADLPGYNALTFSPYTRRIYSRVFRMTIGLRVCLPPRPDAVASYALRVPRAGDLPTASSGPRLAAAALAARLTVPAIRVRKGLAPPSECALPGAQIKRPPIPGRTGGLEILFDLLPSAGITQQVRGVVPLLAESLSRSSSPSKSGLILPSGQKMSRTKRKLTADSS